VGTSSTLQKPSNDPATHAALKLSFAGLLAGFTLGGSLGSSLVVMARLSVNLKVPYVAGT
jgi:hypothetical protein